MESLRQISLAQLYLPTLKTPCSVYVSSTDVELPIPCSNNNDWLPWQQGYWGRVWSKFE